MKSQHNPRELGGRPPQLSPSLVEDQATEELTKRASSFIAFIHQFHPDKVQAVTATFSTKRNSTW